MRIERRGSLSLTPEAAERLGILSNLIWQELQRHKAAQTSVLSLVDYTHPAAPKFFYDAVVRDGLADHQGQILRG